MTAHPGPARAVAAQASAADPHRPLHSQPERSALVARIDDRLPGR